MTKTGQQAQWKAIFGGSHIRCIASHRPIPFLQAAAEHCFWSVGLASLQRLATFLEISPKPPTLVEAFIALIRRFAKVKDNDLFDILAMRLGKAPMDYSDVLQRDEAKCAFVDEEKELQDSVWGRRAHQRTTLSHRGSMPLHANKFRSLWQ